MLSQTFEPKITPDQSCPCFLKPSAWISKQNICLSPFSPHLKPLEFTPSVLNNEGLWGRNISKTTSLASPDSRGFRRSSCIAVGPWTEHSCPISTWIGLASYYYLTTRRVSEFPKCCLQRSVLETQGRWEADASRRMSHAQRFGRPSSLCNIFTPKAGLIVLDEAWFNPYVQG